MGDDTSADERLLAVKRLSEASREIERLEEINKELLGALEEAVEDLWTIQDLKPSSWSIDLTEYRAAIAKAKGETDDQED